MVENPRSRKNTRVAEEELQRGFLEFQLPDAPEGSEEKEGKRRK